MLISCSQSTPVDQNSHAFLLHVASCDRSSISAVQNLGRVLFLHDRNSGKVICAEHNKSER
jgi:hypothetical protein